MSAATPDCPVRPARLCPALRLGAAVAALALLALAGCSTQAAPSAAQMASDCRSELAPTAPRPLPRLQLFGNSGEHWAAVGDGCSLPVGLQEMGVQLHLPLSLREDDVRRRLQVQGLTPLRTEWLANWSGRNLLQISFPAGPVGQRFSVSLTGVPGADGRPLTLALKLYRVAPAAVTVTVRLGDRPWQPLAPDDVLAPGPFSLRATFSAPVDQGGVESAFWSRLKGLAPADAPRLAWVDATTLQVDFPRLRGDLVLGLRDAYDLNGLAIQGEAPVLHAGLPAQLAAVDVASRRESRLYALPPDPRWVAVAPSGRWLAVGSEREGSPDPVPVVWAVEGRSGLRQQTALTAASGWLRDDLLVGRQGERLALWDPTAERPVAAPDLPLAEAAAISPDGSRFAWLRWDTPPATVGAVVSADLLVFTPATQAVQTYPNFLHRTFNLKPATRDQSVHLAWAPDGASIAALDTQLDQASGASRVTLVSLNLSTSKVTPLLPAQAGTALGTGVAYAPDGRHILVGDAVWDLGLGSKKTAALPVRTGAGVWSPDGHYLLTGGNWGPVYAVDAATGKRTDLGPGLAAGWLPDGRALVVRMAGG